MCIDATGNTSILDDKFITSVDPTSTDLDIPSGVASGVFIPIYGNRCFKCPKQITETQFIK